MSLVVVHASFLSLSPRVSQAPTLLTAESPFLVRMFTLGSYERRVIADGSRATLTISTKSFWREPKVRTIPFRDIRCFTYEFNSLGTDWSFSLFRPFQRQDQLESFAVGVRLAGGEHLKLFSFRGEGSRRTGWSGVFFGDSIVDFSGKQEATSRHYVDSLCEMTGKPIGDKTPSPLEHIGRRTACSNCGRPRASRSAPCYYCKEPGRPKKTVEPIPLPSEDELSNVDQAIDDWNSKQ